MNVERALYDFVCLLLDWACGGLNLVCGVLFEDVEHFFQ
jgi:hypothetical protein